MHDPETWTTVWGRPEGRGAAVGWRWAKREGKMGVPVIVSVITIKEKKEIRLKVNSKLSLLELHQVLNVSISERPTLCPVRGKEMHPGVAHIQHLLYRVATLFEKGLDLHTVVTSRPYREKGTILHSTPIQPFCLI